MRGINRLFKPRGYLEGIKRRFAGSSLNLNFISGAQSLDNRVTFSRASNATLVGPDGTIQYAPHNLLTHSEQFDNAAWAKTATTASANSVSAPNGTSTADKLVESSTNDFHVTAQYVSGFSAGSLVFVSFYAKAEERFAFRIQTDAGAGFGYSDFNLQTGNVVNSFGIASNAQITAVGGGWYRCSVLFTASAAGAVGIKVIVSLGASYGVAYLGDGTSGLYIWGAQLNVGTLQPYYPTTVKNLLGYTQEFDNAAWTKSNATVAPNSTAAPNSLMLADKVVPTTTAGDHLVGFTAAGAAVSGTVYTSSVYAKAAGYNFIRLSLGNVAGGGFTFFDLSTGTVGTTSGMASSSITPVGDGWYRCAVSRAATSSANIGSDIYITSANNQFSWAGDGTSGVYIWGAQLSDSASLDPYVYNPGAAPAAQAYYGPRFDYDPVTLAPKGLLIEEQRTNLLAHSSNFTDAIWIKGTGVSVTSNTSLAPDGTLTADEFTVNGTSQTIYQAVSVTAGTAYSCTAFVKLGSMLVSEYKVAIYNITAAAFIAVDITPTEVVSSGAWTKISYVFTAPAGCTSVRWYPFRNSATISTKTIQLWGSQVEAGSFPTSYIPTTSAAATRAADVAVMTGANFSSWYRQDEGTLFAEVGDALTPSATSAAPCIASINDNSAANRLGIFQTATARRFIVNSGATTSAQIDVSGTAAFKSAAAYKTDSFAFATNGQTGTEDTAGAVPVTPIQLNIGSDRTSINVISGHIRRLAYFPRRLANSELQALTR